MAFGGGYDGDYGKAAGDEGPRGPSSGVDSRDFDLKLRLILRTVGVSTQKELHARLKQLNPDTGFTPERAYKWINGRSSPRDRSIFDDLARLLALTADREPMSGEALRTSDFETFYAMMLARYGDRVSRDMAPAAPAYAEGRATVPRLTSSAPAGPQSEAGLPIPGYVLGSYIAVSPAWSAFNRGAFVLGAATISRGDDGAVVFRYEESLPGGDYLMQGRLIRYGRSLHVLIADPDGEDVISMVFAVPGSPGVLLTGVMSGVPPHDAELRPVAGRILCIDAGYLPGLGPISPGMSVAETAVVQKHWTGCLAAQGELGALFQAAGVGRAEALAGKVWDYVSADCEAGLMHDGKAGVNEVAGLLLT